MDKMLIAEMASKADMLIGRNSRRSVSKGYVKKVILSRSLRIDPYFWNNGALSWAVSLYLQNTSDNKSVFVNNDKLLGRVTPMSMVDNTLFYYANYHLISDTKKDEVCSFLLEYKRDSVGSVMYRPDSDSAFLDTIGMIVPFLVRYGAERRDKNALELALTQFRAFFAHGLDVATGLPYHGYDIEDSYKCGVIGWGRGIGWLVIGLSESLKWLEPSSDEYREVERYFLDLIKCSMQYLRSDGGFGWQLQATEGHLDTSVVGMIGYAIASYNNLAGRKCIYEHEIKKMLGCLLENISDDGLVQNSSAECRGFSMYPQVFEVNSWGQGFGLLFIMEATKAGKQHE